MTKYVRGMELILAGDYAAAIPLLTQAAARDKSDIEQIWAVLELAHATLLSGEFDAAEAQYLQMSKRAVGSLSWHHLGIGLCRWARKDYSGC